MKHLSQDQNKNSTAAGHPGTGQAEGSNPASLIRDLNIGSIKESADYPTDKPTATAEPAPAENQTLTRVGSADRPRTPSPNPAPSLDTVTQPDRTSTELPANLKERIKESYDAIAPVYNQWTLLHQARRMHYTTRLLGFLRADRRHKDGEGLELINLNGMRALEVGCGTGVPVLEILLAKEMETIGVDISATQIALAQAHFPTQTATGQAVWEQKDMMVLGYPPGEFDVVIGLYSLIHLPREEQRIFLNRAHRWLKAGGMLMINFPKEELQGDVMEHWLGQDKGWMFWSSWGEEKMMQIIEDLEGMEVLLREVTETDAADPAFVWVVARKNRVEGAEGPADGTARREGAAENPGSTIE
ncbi:S-adenosyl-L-methionine-dependent methyltransferase [Thermothelomyces heterothallicus CBS 202.75]|uniref:S-adenosyl-L-methionine-dependent methyltransferase n=1 Tax=Thermothelomyces heterothallicus CBS 202.75 TaxID=1149848 RepID=UPI003744ADD9